MAFETPKTDVCKVLIICFLQSMSLVANATGAKGEVEKCARMAGIARGLKFQKCHPVTCFFPKENLRKFVMKKAKEPSLDIADSQPVDANVHW